MIVVDELMSTLGDCMVVQIRTPAYVAMLRNETFSTFTPLTSRDVKSGGGGVSDGGGPCSLPVKARIGHHNDCFLWSETDRGTYATAGQPGDRASWLKLLARDTKHTSWGGETCGTDGDAGRITCANALASAAER